MKEILDVKNTYDTLINSLMTLLTIIVSIIAVVQTRKIAKKDHEMLEQEAIRNEQQYEEGLLTQKEQFEKQLKRAEEVERIQEQPRLVFKEARISEKSDAIQDPIAMVGEKINTLWTLGCDTELVDFMASIPINYTDASGRKYVQVFDIIFHKEGYASITNFANPELC